MALIAYVTVLVALVGMSSALVIREGNCPNVTGMGSVDYTKYAGLWYEYKRFPAVFENGLECNEAVYVQTKDHKIKYINTGLRRAQVFGRRYVVGRNVVEGNATIPDPRWEGALSVSFGRVTLDRCHANYYIILTNYTDWSLTFSCEEFQNFNIQFAWILTRERGVVPGNIYRLEQGLEEAGIEISNFRIVDQTDCPSYF